MKYLFIIILMTIIIAGMNNVIAGTEPVSKMTQEPGGEAPVQGFAPDPDATVFVQGPSSKMIEVSGRLCWSFYNTGNDNNCIFRILSSKDKGKFPKLPISPGENRGFVINKKTTFVNLSGCTGVLLIQ